VKKIKAIGFCSFLLIAAVPAWAQQSAPEFNWKQSLPIRPGDPAINRIGGTEVRAITTMDNKLFAAVGYWEDIDSENPALPGAQVLRLDSATSPWRVDLELDDRNPRGLRLYQAISNFEKVQFTEDSAGRPLTPPVEMLLAGAWKRGEGLDIFSRASGSPATPWSKTRIPGQEEAVRGTHFRSFGVHKDAVTGSDVVFAGANNAIFVGKYNRDSQNIEWSPRAEWQSNYAGGSAKGRVSSFAECRGKLYAAAYDTVYERADGPAPSWKKVWGTTIQAKSNRVTGLRGLTCSHGVSGADDVMLVGVEDFPSRIYRIELMRGFKSTLELDVSAFLTKALSTEAKYGVVAYNDMTAYPDPAGSCTRYLIGLEANTPDAPETFDRHNPNAHFLVRDCNGGYTLHEIHDPQITPQPQLVSVRSLAVSPFPDDPPGTVYAGGFDTNRNKVHNSAWLYKGVPAAGSK
jgi:hypothetical protein